MRRLSKKEIRKFLFIFNKLSNFECSQRIMGRHGAFGADELPIPEVIKVLNWLKEISK